jgi:hypothetical protein
MRTVARYSLLTNVPETRDPVEDYLNLLERVRVWIHSKGEEGDGEGSERVIRFRDGREATIRRTDVDVDLHGIRELVLTEPSEHGTIFETRVAVGSLARELAVFCELRVGRRDDPIGPIRFDAGCPRILRDFLSYDLPWTYGETAIPKNVLRFRGDEGGSEFAALLTNARRSLPLVAIAEYEGFVLHPNIAEAAALDLACLAGVAVLDDRATWGLTRAVGEEWSCYNGAIRLYWPGADTTGNPWDHPLWTARRLLENSPDTNIAARRIRDALRRRIMSMSAFTVREPHLFAAIRADERQATLAKQRADLTSAEDFMRLAESYAVQVEQLRTELENRNAEIETLRAQVSNLEVAVRWRDAAPSEEPEPVSAAPPATLSEAVARAHREHSDTLLLGPEVESSIQNVASDAGPPDKVWQYLCSLAEYSRARHAGPVGTSTLEWFKQRNIAASTESQTIMNSSVERARRTWSDGNEKRFFHWHLKPAEAVHPDRCVRIYFEWDESRNIIVVPYIGRHP